MKLGKRSPDDVVSVLGEGMEVLGEISFTRGLRVDGVIKGKIHSESSLVVGSKGKVEAEVIARRISINGEFHGIIHASDRVEIQREGRVYGDLYTPCLIIEAGALFEGRCNMSDRKIAKQDEATLLKVVDSEPDAPKASHQSTGY